MRPKLPCIAICAALALFGCQAATDNASLHYDKAQDQSAPAVAAPATSNADEKQSEQLSANERPVSACLIQDGRRVAENAIHAVGTEPFWAADVEGRCVTYSTPENQSGTRIWTRVEATAAATTWTGALDGQPFVMTTSEQKGCSDGMSDMSYPIGVVLTVRGEQRRGCAEQR